MGMKITISLNDDLMKEITRIAADRGTTITGLVRDYLTKLTSECKTPETKQRELEALERSFKKFHCKLGPRTWRREDLYERH